jgi:FtsP/CotA-like multicopper oxidase with cupredoxin domain
MMVNRRLFLQVCIGSTAAWATGCRRNSSRPAVDRRGSVAELAEPQPGPADVQLLLRTDAGELSILDGAPTRVWRFSGSQLAGRSGAVQPAPAGSYLGPTLELRRGETVRVGLENGLEEPTIVHWHGLYVAAEADGHPRDVIGRGERYEYALTVRNPAGTYWYHPHPADRTGPQVYRGLAGVLIVRDEEEAELGLPPVDQELILLLQDRLFDRGNQLVYQFDQMAGFLGDAILVNGQVPGPIKVRRGTYRLRLINGSSTRIFKLAWSDRSTVVVIASDGGLLPAPLELPYVVLAPGERTEIWADFGRAPAGQQVTLQSLAFRGTELHGGMGMGRGRMGRGMGTMGPDVALAQGDPFDVQRFEVTGRGAEVRRPTRLARVEPLPRSEVPVLPLVARFQHMQWTLNGHLFELEEVAPHERIPFGAVVEWQLENESHMMAMAHPIHLHGPSFQLVSRSGADETLSRGFVDTGWKDTVLLTPGARIRVRARYDLYRGLFLYHCHNLEHEDMGMMRNYRVEP